MTRRSAKRCTWEAALVWVLFWGPACRDSGNPARLTAERFPSRYAEAVCAQSFRCCPKPALNELNQALCEEQARLGQEARLTRLKMAEANGRAAFDEAEAATCIAALDALACSAWIDTRAERREPPACARLVSPRVANGGACADDSECTSGFCFGEDNESEVPQDGLCRVGVAVGLACDPAAGEARGSCPPSAYCDEEKAVCLERKGKSFTCGDGFECRSGLCEDGVCVAPEALCYGASSL